MPNSGTLAAFSGILYGRSALRQESEIQTHTRTPLEDALQSPRALPQARLSNTFT